jgi:hypothetical protein
VRIGSALTKRGDGGPYEARIPLAHRREAEATLVQKPRGTRLDDEIGVAHQRQPHSLAIGGFQIQGDATFVGVRDEPGEAALGVWFIAVKRPEAALESSPGWFDLDDIRTEVGEELASGPADRLRQVQHTIGLKSLG